MNNYNINNPITDFVDQLLNKSVSEVVKKDFTNTKPAVNIVKLENSYLLQVAAPGMKKEDFEISLDNDKITISASIESTEKEKIFTRKEFDYNSFKRSFIIPKNIDRTNIKAKYKLGILEVTLGKKEEKEQESVSIEIG